MKWNVGFIGFGFIGKIHALAYRSLPFYYDNIPGQYNLAAVATSRDETAQKAVKDFGFETATTNWRKIVEDPSIQILHIAHPNIYHKEVLLAAMSMGKHIYCEKPLTATWSEAEEVLNHFHNYSGISQVCVQNRFQAAMVRAAALAGEGFLGDILSFRGVYLHSGILSQNRILNWKATLEEAGGGVINDLAPHVFDLLQLLCGRFKEVFCQKQLCFPQRKVETTGGITTSPTAEDQAVMLLKLSNDTVGTVEVSKVATGKQDELIIEVHGKKGAMRFNLMSPYWLHVFDQKSPDNGWSKLPTGGNFKEKGAVPGKSAVGWMRGHIASMYNFLSAVSNGKPTRPDIKDGVQLQAVIEAAYKSSETNSWEKVVNVGND